MSTDMLTKRKTTLYLAHFIFLFVQAFIALLLLLLTPNEENHAIFLRYSYDKLLLFSFPVGLSLAAIGLFIRFRSLSQLYKLDRFLDRRLKPGTKNWIFTICTA